MMAPRLSPLAVSGVVIGMKRQKPQKLPIPASDRPKLVAEANGVKACAARTRLGLIQFPPEAPIGIKFVPAGLFQSAHGFEDALEIFLAKPEEIILKNGIVDVQEYLR
jgi:hypothetical protein